MMRKIMMMVLSAAVIGGTVPAVSAAELSVSAKSDKYGEYSIIDNTYSEITWTYDTVNKGLTQKSGARDNYSMVWNIQNTPSPITGTWSADSGFTDLSGYSYFSLFLNRGASDEPANRASIKLLSEDGENDIEFPEIDLSGRQTEVWYELSFPISATAGVKYTGISIDLDRASVYFDDFAVSTKDPVRNLRDQGKFIAETVENQFLAYGSPNGLSTGEKTNEVGRMSKTRKIYIEKTGGFLTTTLKQSADISQYRYLSFWAYSDKGTQISIVLKNGSTTTCTLSSTVSAGKWARYSYYIGGITKDLTGINFASTDKSTVAASIWLDDIMLSEDDPVKADSVYQSEFTLTNSDGAETENTALTAGTYTISGSIINNTVQTLDNVTIAAAAYDSVTGALVSVKCLDPKSVTMNNLADNAQDYSAELTVDKDGSYIRVYAWNMDSLKPFTKVMQ